jgi:hypothetical protein
MVVVTLLLLERRCVTGRRDRGHAVLQGRRGGRRLEMGQVERIGGVGEKVGCRGYDEIVWPGSGIVRHVGRRRRRPSFDASRCNRSAMMMLLQASEGRDLLDARFGLPVQRTRS